MHPPASITRHRIAAGFTLLEAILALGILAAATIVALDIRAQMMRSSIRVREVQREDRDHEALFEMLVSGMLDDPRIDEETGYIWTGDFLDAPYRITRSVTTVPNPMRAAVTYDVHTRVPVIVYRIEHRDRTTEFFWHE